MDLNLVQFLDQVSQIIERQFHFLLFYHQPILEVVGLHLKKEALLRQAVFFKGKS
jgi:hypothetical protein